MGTAEATGTRLMAYRLFWICFATVLVADQLSKIAIVEWSGFQQGLYPPFDGLPIIPGYFNLVYAINYGAAWGMFAGLSWLLISLAFAVLIFIWFFRNSLELKHPRLQVCFGLMCAGIVGNTIDRISRGHVVDFLDVHLQFYRWPTFNFADSAIVVGTLFYLLLQFKPARA
ncbi:MAG: signal peptidase [Verrucomicrobiota bacterium]